MTAAEDQPPAFPARPVRSLRVVHSRQKSCPSDFALIVVDLEPWEEGVEFEVHAGLRTPRSLSATDLAAFTAATEEGLRAELAVLGAEVPVAVAVVLRALDVHEVDSHAGAFRTAGRLAVRRALEELRRDRS